MCQVLLLPCWRALGLGDLNTGQLLGLRSQRGLGLGYTGQLLGSRSSLGLGHLDTGQALLLHTQHCLGLGHLDSSQLWRSNGALGLGLGHLVHERRFGGLLLLLARYHLSGSNRLRLAYINPCSGYLLGLLLL